VANGAPRLTISKYTKRRPIWADGAPLGSELMHCDGPNAQGPNFMGPQTETSEPPSKFMGLKRKRQIPRVIGSLLHKSLSSCAKQPKVVHFGRWNRCHFDPFSGPDFQFEARKIGVCDARACAPGPRLSFSVSEMGAILNPQAVRGRGSALRPPSSAPGFSVRGRSPVNFAPASDRRGPTAP
jgi:hypothetical protein